MIYILPTDTCFGIACPIIEHESYEKIYKIKKRDFSKPLAILVPNFEWLEKHTILNKAQIEFLKNYEKAWTILTESPSTKVWIDFVDEETGEEFRNRGVYEKIAFRVANNLPEKKLLKKEGPMFLTSANLSGKEEIYELKEIREDFADYLKKGVIKLLGEELGDLKKSHPSEIFEFIGDGTEQKFLRK